MREKESLEIQTAEKILKDLVYRWGWKERDRIRKVLFRSGFLEKFSYAVKDKPVWIVLWYDRIDHYIGVQFHEDVSGTNAFERYKHKTFEIKNNEEIICELIDDFVYRCEKEYKDEIRRNNNTD